MFSAFLRRLQRQNIIKQQLSKQKRIGNKIANNKVLLLELDCEDGEESEEEHIPEDRLPVKHDEQLKVTFVFTHVLQPTVPEAASQLMQDELSKAFPSKQLRQDKLEDPEQVWQFELHGRAMELCPSS